MIRLPIFILLLLITAGIQAGSAFKDLTPEQRESMREYMDVPEPEPESQPEVVKNVPAQPSIQGSRSVADKAYKNKDYQTAIKHYKALAKEGDGEASAIVGTMYQDGLGTEKDLSKARAWYKNADDEDDSWGDPLAEALEKDALSADELAKSNELYKELRANKEPGSNTNDSFIADSNIADTNSHNRDAHQLETTRSKNTFDITKQVKITPEKYSRDTLNQLSKTRNMEHFKPEKYTRQN
ncbi:MAG: hypothetical protein AAF419_00940 [Pseudomonadota bacterium]